MSNFPTNIDLDHQTGDYTGPWTLDGTSTSTVKKYHLSSGYGIEFHDDGSGNTVFKVNESANQGSTTGESGKPMSFDVIRAGSTTSGQTSYNIEDDDQIICRITDGTRLMAFTVDMDGTATTDTGGNTVGPNKLLFSSSGGGGFLAESSDDDEPPPKVFHNFW